MVSDFQPVPCESLVWRTTAYKNDHGNDDSKDKKKPKDWA
jgi:hypothetical protein